MHIPMRLLLDLIGAVESAANPFQPIAGRKTPRNPSENLCSRIASCSHSDASSRIGNACQPITHLSSAHNQPAHPNGNSGARRAGAGE